jgi:hypothetical protein
LGLLSDRDGYESLNEAGVAALQYIELQEIYHIDYSAIYYAA